MGNIPIWVTDPTGNNNPFLKIKPTILFVGAEDALYDTAPIPNIIANMRFWWSSDGINWNIANNEADSLNKLGSGNSFLYDNGSWAAILSYDNGFPLGQQVGVYSHDGQNWRIGLNPTASNNNTVGVVYDSVNNGWTFTAHNGQTAFVVIPTTLPPAIFGNDLGPGGDSADGPFGPFADPSQTSAPANKTLKNSLSNSWTAVRYGTDPNTGPPFADILQYTVTSITTAIVNSGTGWPDATWVTTFTFPHSAAIGNGGGPLFHMTYAKA